MGKKKEDLTTDNIPMVGNIPPKREDGDLSNKAFIISNKKEKDNKTTIIIIAILCLLAVAGCIYYFLTRNK